MRVWKALLTASLVAASSASSALVARAQTAAASSAPASGVVADVPMLMRGPMPAVEVLVNGKGPFLFAIDTGAAGRARFDASLAETLKLQKVGEARASDPSGRNVRTLDVLRADAIEFGGLRFERVDAPSRDYNLSPRLPKIDGILGLGLFAGYLLTLDYPARRVRVSRGELPAADGREIIGYENPRGVPVVELWVGGRKVSAHLDTGNTVGGFVLPEWLAKELTFASEPVVVGRARTVSSDMEIREARIKESLRIGRHEFPGAAVTFPAVADLANVGSRALAEFALTFDLKNKRLRLERSTPTAQADPANAATAAKSETNAAAAAVAPQTPAATTARAHALEEYAGLYGERAITLEGGALHLQRPGGPKLKSISKPPGGLWRLPGGLRYTHSSMTAYGAVVRNTSHAQRPTLAFFASPTLARYLNWLPCSSVRFDSL